MKSKNRVGEFAPCVVQQDRDFRRQNSNYTLNSETPNLNQKIEKKLLISKYPVVLLVFLPFSISRTFDFPHSFFSSAFLPKFSLFFFCIPKFLPNFKPCSSWKQKPPILLMQIRTSNSGFET